MLLFLRGDYSFVVAERVLLLKVPLNDFYLSNNNLYDEELADKKNTDDRN